MRIEVLLERLSDIVYHATDYDSAVSIIESDRFKLTPAFSSKHEAGSKMFYLSTTRSRIGEYRRGDFIAMLKLDGRKLSERYKGGAFNYGGGKLFRDELEDRLWSDSPYLENAGSYILGIDISFPHFDMGMLDNINETFSREYSDITKLAKFCKSRGIPFRFYSEQKDMYAGSNRFYSAEDIITNQPDYKDAADMGQLSDEEVAKIEEVKNKVIGTIDFLMELLSLEPSEDNLKRLEHYKWLEVAYNFFSKATHLKISNHLDTPMGMHNKDFDVRKEMESLGRLMRSKGLGNVSDLEQWIREHWYSV